eukprot:6632323-Prymnesium_polylepis.1
MGSLKFAAPPSGSRHQPYHPSPRHPLALARHLPPAVSARSAVVRGGGSFHWSARVHTVSWGLMAKIRPSLPKELTIERRDATRIALEASSKGGKT